MADQAIGKAIVVYGTVKAESADGVERVLQPNSPIFMNDRINTGSEGAVSFAFTDAANTQLDLGRMTDMIIDQSVLGAEEIDLEEVTAEIEAIQQALLEGETIEGPATAAGATGAAAGAGGGGRLVVKFDADGKEGEVTSGAETQGVGYDFTGTEQQIIVEPQLAVVSPVVLTTPTRDPDPDPDPDPFTPPELGDGEGIVDESQLPWGTNAVLSPDVTLVEGSLDVEFGSAPQVITFASVETGNTLTWSPGQTVTVAGAHGLLTINPEGSWVYDVDENVFHPNAGLTGTDDSLPDDFTMTIDYVDGAGTPQTVTGNLDFEVLDDGPKLTGAAVDRIVEEEAMDIASVSAIPVLSDGNPDDVNDRFPGSDGLEDPSVDNEDGLQPDSSIVTGNLSSLAIVGADSPGTWSVTGTNGLPELFSQGDQVMYRQVGNTIEAYVERSGGDETTVEQIVFTFDLQTNGDYTFTLFDQLDHVGPVDPLMADENVELQISGDEQQTSVDSIDFSQTIQVVDSDNDPLILGPGTLTFTMVDDVPVLTLSGIEYDGDEAYEGVLFGDVQEDALGNETETLDSEQAPYNDSSTGNLEDPPGDTDTATLDLSSLVEFSIGADEYSNPEQTGLTYSITELEGDKQQSAYTSNGKEVWYFKEGDNLVARAGDGGVVDGTVVYTVSVVSDTGLLTFDLDDQLDHDVTDDDQKGDSGELVVDDFGQYVQAEIVDFDDDRASETFDGRIQISVENDVPEVTETANYYYESEYAGYDNIIGTYTLDEGGNPTDLQIVIPSTNAEGNGAEPNSPLGVFKGDFDSDAKIFIIANGGNQSGLGSITETATVVYNTAGDGSMTVGGEAVTAPVYFMDQALNLNEAGGTNDHFMDHYRDIITESPLYGGEVGIEDLNLGDADYDDAVLRIEKGPVVTESALDGGSDGVGPDGKLELAPAALTAEGNFFANNDTSMIQIKSGADEPLKLVLTSTTIPDADGSASDHDPLNPAVPAGEFYIDPSNDGSTSVIVDSEVGTLEVWDNGDWQYTLNENTEGHPDNDPSGAAGNDGDYDRFSSDQVQDVFNLNLTDSDGDEVATRLIININDDGPVANNDVGHAFGFSSYTNIGGQGEDGTPPDVVFDVLENDTQGADGATVTSIVSWDGGGAVDLDDDGKVVFTPTAGWSGETVITYEITDADGDTSQATLTVIEDRLIVGQNENDDDEFEAADDFPYVVGEGADESNYGTIDGGQGNDILIGDYGGISSVGGKLELMFILDVSGSMGGANLAGLKTAMTTSFNSLATDPNASEVRVHVVQFSGSASLVGVGTYDITTPAELTAANEAIEALSAGGYTNYEAGMQLGLEQAALDPLSGADRQAFFISDGQPNRSINDSNNNVEFYSDNSTGYEAAFKQVDGTVVASGGDGPSSDEIAQIEAWAPGQVEAIYITSNSENVDLTRMDEIASGDAFTSNPVNIADIILDATGSESLANVGDDTIEGGGGDDLIYGDAVFTDDVWADLGVAVTDIPDGWSEGAGWKVFELLEDPANGFDGDDGQWTRTDTINYILENQAELAQETTTAEDPDGRQGGGDTISGDTEVTDTVDESNDTVFGQEGDDTISGGEDNDLLVGGTGEDDIDGDAGNDLLVGDAIEIIPDGIDVVEDGAVDTLDGGAGEDIAVDAAEVSDPVADDTASAEEDIVETDTVDVGIGEEDPLLWLIDDAPTT